MTKQLILCDCSGSQTIDPKVIEGATGLTCSKIHTALCTREAEVAAKAIASGETIIACQQEAQRFDELATELSAEAPLFVDIRDRAGWNDEKDASPKMAALVAEALIPAPAVKTVDVVSEGMCLIIGAGAVALPAAEKLADTLAVTVLLTDGADLPLTRAFEVVRGKLAKAAGTFGDFKVRIDGFQMLNPAGRGEFTLTAPRDGAETRCDVIVDLSGATSLFPAPHKHDGYLRADPGQPAGRGRSGCTGQRDGRHIRKNPVPDAGNAPLRPFPCRTNRLHPLLGHLPHRRDLPCGRACGCGPDGLRRLRGLRVFVSVGCDQVRRPARQPHPDPHPHLGRNLCQGGGKAPRLLVHDDHGAEMISLSARFGRGLPADVIPLAIPALAEFGHAEMLAALSAALPVSRSCRAPEPSVIPSNARSP